MAIHSTIQPHPQPSQDSFFFPVAESTFLAYSCAAARDSHPLPCLRRAAKTRVPIDITKIKDRRSRPRNLAAPSPEVNRRDLFAIAQSDFLCVLRGLSSASSAVKSF